MSLISISDLVRMACSIHISTFCSWLFMYYLRREKLSLQVFYFWVLTRSTLNIHISSMYLKTPPASITNSRATVTFLSICYNSSPLLLPKYVLAFAAITETKQSNKYRQHGLKNRNLLLAVLEAWKCKIKVRTK